MKEFSKDSEPERYWTTSKIVIAVLLAWLLLTIIGNGLIAFGVIPDDPLGLGSKSSAAGAFLKSLLLFGIATALYFLPTVIAKIKDRRNIVAIAVINLCFGWTVLGWFIALIWALTEPAPPPVIYVQPPRRDDPGPRP